MAVYKREGSKFYLYDFTVEGKRFRGSTKTAKMIEAKAKEAAMILAVQERGSAAVRPAKAPTLKAFAERFLEWSDASSLEAPTKRYYAFGWRLLSSTPLANLKLCDITRDHADTTQFMRESAEVSASYANQALRTLNRMLSKAQEWKLIREVPKIKLRKAYGRDAQIDPDTEKRLVAALGGNVKHKRVKRLRDQLRDILVIAQDSGMRRGEIFRIRIEHIDWQNRRIWNPYGKTQKARRWCAMSERMMDLLFARCGDRKEGWLFPSSRSACGHVTTIAKGFQEMRKRASVSTKIVLHSARHTYASKTMADTGNVFAVANSMGHATLKSMEPYQHHELDAVRQAIDNRNLLHGLNDIPGTSSRTVQ